MYANPIKFPLILYTGGTAKNSIASQLNNKLSKSGNDYFLRYNFQPTNNCPSKKPETMNPSHDPTSDSMMMDTSLRLPDVVPNASSDSPMNGRVCVTSLSSSSTRRGGMEESWNGLFMTSASEMLPHHHHHHHGDSVTSNKKLGHASFTDLGLYAKNANIAPKDLSQKMAETRHQFMKLRFQRLSKSNHWNGSLSSVIPEDDNDDEHQQQQEHQQHHLQQEQRMHESDSALLRRASHMGTSELDGLWYKAKHPRHSCLARLIHSAPELGDLKELSEEDEDEDNIVPMDLSSSS